MQRGLFVDVINHLQFLQQPLVAQILHQLFGFLDRLLLAAEGPLDLGGALEDVVAAEARLHDILRHSLELAQVAFGFIDYGSQLLRSAVGLELAQLQADYPPLQFLLFPQELQVLLVAQSMEIQLFG